MSEPVVLSVEWGQDRILLKVMDLNNKQAIETIPYAEKPVFGARVIEKPTLIIALRELADMLEGKQP